MQLSSLKPSRPLVKRLVKYTGIGGVTWITVLNAPYVVQMAFTGTATDIIVTVPRDQATERQVSAVRWVYETYYDGWNHTERRSRLAEAMIDWLEPKAAPRGNRPIPRDDEAYDDDDWGNPGYRGTSRPAHGTLRRGFRHFVEQETGRS